ncbi:hypothetical protein [Nocardia asteroides]|uniref:hypothetical protein n=1 Tax=Nocardia asteroides TaxID=1824 RepID=UPI001E3137A0|nr:hypothetical protein [Nocardia asteroides]UGT64601.1 hypothetical protein LTT61_15490 [Nocardia asteroides]
MSPDPAEQPKVSTEKVVADPPQAESAGTGSRLRTVVGTVAAVLLVVSLGAALWFGVGWARAAFFTDGPRAEARDSALDGARQAALNMTTMNIDDVPGSLATARSSMTGAILDSATKNQQQAEQLASQAGVRMEAKVLGASLTALNSEEDKATALVVLQVGEQRKDSTAAQFRYTWTLDMTQVDGVWKVEQVAALGQPVLLDGGGVPAAPGAPAETPAPAPAPQPGS